MRQRPPSDGSPDSLDLVRRAQRGDLEALDRLFARYYPRVLAIVRVRLGSALRERMESSDVLHAALIDAVRSFDRFEPRDAASMTHWLARIVENCIRESARRERAAARDPAWERAFAHLATSRSSLNWEPAAATESAGSEVQARERRAQLEACLAELEEAHREVLLLRHYAEAPWESVAEIMGHPSPDAARMLHARALNALRKSLQKRGVHDFSALL